MKLTKVFMLIPTTLLMQSCTLMNAKSECSWTQIITVSKDDKLTRLTAEEIVAHNEKREKFCK